MPASDVEGYALGYRFNSANYVSDEFADLSGYGGPVRTRTGTPTFETKNGHEGLLLNNTWHGDFFHPNSWQGTMVAVVRAELLTSGTHTTYPIIFDSDGATGNTGRLSLTHFSGQRNLNLNSIGAVATPTQNLSSAINVVGLCHDQETRRGYSQRNTGSLSTGGQAASSIDGHDMAMGSTLNGAIIGAVTGSSANTTLETDHAFHLFEMHFFTHNPMVNDADAFTLFMAELFSDYQAAPTLNGTLADREYIENTGVQTYDASVGSTGAGRIFSLVSPPAGVTIAPTTGIISTDTDVLSLQTDTAITVRASAGGASVDQVYNMDIVAEGGIVYLANWRADKNVTTSGTDVTLWRDQSNNALDLTTISTADDTQLVTLNSNDAVDFPHGANEEAMQATGSGPAIGAPKALTFIFAGVIDDAEPGTFAARIYSERLTTGPMIFTEDTNALGFFWDGSTNLDKRATNVLTPGSPVVIVIRYDGTTNHSGVEFFINGVEPSYTTEADGVSLSTSSEDASIGANPDYGSDVEADMKVGRIQIIDGALTDAQINTLANDAAAYVGSTWTDL